jgi:uncharacterized protein (DUF1810 family)
MAAFDLQRFVDAQEAGGTYERALGELRAGRKTSHWMWFVFPQLAGLGRSEMAQRYALGSLEEARAYLEHPLLGPRLRACCAALLAGAENGCGADARTILGDVDALKLRSSMTLFGRAGGDEALCARVLERFFGGEEDAATIALLPG